MRALSTQLSSHRDLARANVLEVGKSQCQAYQGRNNGPCTQTRQT